MHPFKNVVFLEHESEILKGNPLGDPHVRTVPVYLPPDYETSGKSYPVVLGITGFTGTSMSYLNRRFLFQGIDEMLNELIEGGMPGVIYVLPDCITSVGGSQYVNSSATGNYDDYLVQELIPWIDGQFRTNGLHGSIGGSSGGIGSFTLAAKHPDVFQAFADHSGDSAFEYCFLVDVPNIVQGLAEYDYKVEEFVRRIPEIQPKGDVFNNLLNMVGMCACYTPNPDAPAGFDLPFDPYTGEIRRDVWERFKQHDPVNMVERYADALRGMRLIWVDCGTKDQFNLYLGSRQLHQRLEQHNIEHIYEEYDSDHFLLRREQERKSIPLVVKALTD